VQPFPPAVWIATFLLTLLVRRDRRVWMRLPVVGVVAAGVVLAAYAAWRRFIAPGPLTFRDAAFLHLVVTLASAGLVLRLVAWLRALCGQDQLRLRQAWRARRGWLLVCLALGLLSGSAYFLVGRQFATRGAFDEYDTLYRADPGRYQHIIAGTASDNEQTTHKHPLFPLLSRTLALGLTPLVGCANAPLAVSSLGGGLCTLLAALYFRRITGSRLLGALLALALAATAAHVVFCAQPETYALCGAALVLLHGVLACGTTRALRLRHEVLVAVCAAGVTITNVVPALICYLARHPARRRWRSVGRWFVLTALAGGAALSMQNVLLPMAALGRAPGEYHSEADYFGPAAPGVVVTRLARGLLLENMIGTAPLVTPSPRGLVLSPGPYTRGPARVAAGIWLALLAGAAGTLLRARAWRQPTLSAALACLGAVAVLHSFYGNDTLFLYSCTYTFYVLAIAAHALPHMPRRVAVVACVVLVLVLALNDILFVRQILLQLGT
jgi:hypothetical protein